MSSALNMIAANLVYRLIASIVPHLREIHSNCAFRLLTLLRRNASDVSLIAACTRLDFSCFPILNVRPYPRGRLTSPHRVYPVGFIPNGLKSGVLRAKTVAAGVGAGFGRAGISKTMH